MVENKEMMQFNIQKQIISIDRVRFWLSKFVLGWTVPKTKLKPAFYSPKLYKISVLGRMV